MIKQSELEVMVCDLFVDAYRAGQSCGDLAYNAARGTRARLIKELADLYAELESESYHREQFEVELKKANEEIERRIDEKHAILNGTPCEGLRQRLYKLYGNKIYGSKLTEDEEEVPDHHDAFDAMFPGCTPDDLPFPDVDELAPASEVIGGDE